MHKDFDSVLDSVKAAGLASEVTRLKARFVIKDADTSLKGATWKTFALLIPGSIRTQDDRLKALVDASRSFPVPTIISAL